jgi:hypothetical protein
LNGANAAGKSAAWQVVFPEESLPKEIERTLFFLKGNISWRRLFGLPPDTPPLSMQSMHAEMIFQDEQHMQEMRYQLLS